MTIERLELVKIFLAIVGMTLGLLLVAAAIAAHLLLIWAIIHQQPQLPAVPPLWPRWL